MNYATVRTRADIKQWLLETTKTQNVHDFTYEDDNKTTWTALFAIKIGFSTLMILKSGDEYACHSFEHDFSSSKFAMNGIYDNYEDMIRGLTDKYSKWWHMN